MKTLLFTFFCLLIMVRGINAFGQLTRQQVVTDPAQVTVRPDLRVADKNLTPEFKVTVNTWNAGKISASQAVISYSIRIDDTAQPMEHGVCYSTSANPTLANPKTSAKGYTINTLYGELSGLKSGTKYYAKAYMKLLNYPDKVYYGNEIVFSTLAGVAK